MTSPLSNFKKQIANFEKRRPFLVGTGLLLLITVAVLSGAYRKPMTTPNGCPAVFLVAHNLVEHGVFSAESAGENASPQSGRPIPPAYPFILALMAYADASLADGIDCEGLAITERQPPQFFDSLVLLQAAAGVAILFIVYHLALELAGSRAIACAVVVLYVIGGKLGEFARHIEPDDFRNLAQFGSLYLLTVASRKQSVALFGAAGASLGATALFSPILGSLLILLPVALMVYSWREVTHTCSCARKALPLGAFLAGGLIVTAPWAARNLLLFGDPMLADQSEALLLAHRAAYNVMPLSDWPLAALSWMPSYGNVITKFFFGEAVANKFAYFSPGAYFANGATIYESAAARTPLNGNPFFTVFNEGVLAAPGWHFLTSIPIFTRGMWGTHGFMGIVGMCLLPRHFRRIDAGHARSALIWVFTFALLQIAIQASFAPNFYWMNTPMLFLAALAIASALPGVARWLDQKYNRLNLPQIKR